MLYDLDSSRRMNTQVHREIINHAKLRTNNAGSDVKSSSDNLFTIKVNSCNCFIVRIYVLHKYCIYCFFLEYMPIVITLSHGSINSVFIFIC